MSATELTPEQSALYSMQYQPRVITQVDILDERPSNAALIAAFSTLPRIGEFIYLTRLNGDTDVLEVTGVTHWAVQVMQGQTEFPSTSKLPPFVDATIVCRQSGLSEQKGKESNQR